MKFKVEVRPELEEIEVVVRTKELNEDVKNIERLVSLYVSSLLVKKDDRTFNISPFEIYYIDAVDHDVFVYTKDDMFKTHFKLYQLEEMFPSILLRVNKNTLVNFKMIQSFKSSFGGRMEAELKNQDRIIISRMYVPNLKKVLQGDKR